MGISQDQDPEDHIGLRKVGGHMQEHMPGLFLDPDNPAAELHRLLFDPERGISEEQAYMWAMNQLEMQRLHVEQEERQRQQQAARMQGMEPDRMARLERDMVLLSDMLDPQRYVNTDAPKSTMTADEIAELLAEQHGNKGKKTAEQLKDKWITSKLFIRQIIPVNAPVGASPVKEGDYSHSTGPIIVDRGKPGYPELFIIDGKHRQAEARARGEREIDAWVGKEALPLLGCAQ
jgi:hypothetical protein